MQQLLIKEWRSILLAIWIFGTTLFLMHINSQVELLRQQGTKLRSTVDSIESVVITTDAGTAELAKKVDGIGANLEFVVAKLRRH